jgi:hypothetical protein
MLQIDTVDMGEITNVDKEAPGAFVSLVVVVVSTLINEEVLVVPGLGGGGPA